MPADVVGTMIYNIKSNEFSIKKDLFLLISSLRMRLTVRLKVQSALLECRKSKLPLATTFKLDRPF
jgi:MoxR-like ATPase